jgi:hypothetical protein
MYGGVRAMLRIENKNSKCLTGGTLSFILVLRFTRNLCRWGDKMMEGKNWKKVVIIWLQKAVMVFL